MKEEQCSGRKGPGKGRSPVAARAPHLGPGARGRRLPFSGFVLLWARGVSRCTARHPGPSAVSRVRSSYSTLPSWTHEDTSVHARGKRPVSRGEAQPAYNSGGDEAPFTSGVCLITRRQTWLLQRPSSLTHPLPSGAWWRAAIKGRGVLIIRGEAADSSHPPPPSDIPVIRPPPTQECYLPQPGSSGRSGRGRDSSPGNSPSRTAPEPGQRNRVLVDSLNQPQGKWQ